MKRIYQILKDLGCNKPKCKLRPTLPIEVITLIQDNPNDADLGKKLRRLYIEIYE